MKARWVHASRALTNARFLDQRATGHRIDQTTQGLSRGTNKKAMLASMICPRGTNTPRCGREGVTFCTIKCGLRVYCACKRCFLHLLEVDGVFCASTGVFCAGKRCFLHLLVFFAPVNSVFCTGWQQHLLQHQEQHVRRSQKQQQQQQSWVRTPRMHCNGQKAGDGLKGEQAHDRRG